ncbi:MAG: hypothetical protein EXR47_07000 [Dehalococcoidia bacterium]|nr:hypothetical protein [Dehalococcoidia bacterium]
MLNLFRSLGVAFSILGELVAFFVRSKRWWLTPVVVVLVLLGLILVFASSTGLGPFIYSLF